MPYYFIILPVVFVLFSWFTLSNIDALPALLFWPILLSQTDEELIEFRTDSLFVATSAVLLKCSETRDWELLISITQGSEMKKYSKGQYSILKAKIQ